MKRYTLPDLAYDYSALEPHLSAQVLELHHDKHHKTYVDGANRVGQKLAEAREQGDHENIAALGQALAFNVSGHVLHSLYWQNLSPDGGGQPRGELAEAIQRDFGGFEPFRKQLTQAAATVMSSGWAALVWEPLAAQLATVQIHDHQSQTIQGCIPLLVLDAWEHAYYAQYRNEKAKYLEAVWNVWNWDDVQQRFDAARTATLALRNVAEEGAAVPGARQPKRTPAPQPPAGRA
jgi:Fe-Mn family superoxide dismutase